jgi:aryl-alcohol dehydrogenase-like predicted oxidoreductase
MKYRKLGRTDLIVSEIGFGCQSIAGGFYYKDERESLKTLQMAFDSGINFFDTSDHYSQGESEILVGKAFKKNRVKIIIGTKAGTLYKPPADILLRGRFLARPFSRYMRRMKIPFHLLRANQKQSDFSEKYLFNAIEKSLKRLQTDYIDLFQLHKPSKAVLQKGDFIYCLEKLKQQGKIRYFGISCSSNEDAFICLNYPQISSLQITINLLDKEYVDEILVQSSAKSIGIIARNPRAQGHLTKDFSDIMAETYAKNKKEFDDKKERARQFRFLIRQDRTLAQAALQYVLQLNGVSAAIPRAVNRDQLQEIIGTFKAHPLSAHDLEEIQLTDNQKVIG